MTGPQAFAPPGFALPAFVPPAFALTAGAVHVRWAGVTRRVPALAAPLGDGWVFGEQAGQTDEAIDVAALVHAPARAGRPETGDLLTGLVVYAAATAGTPSVSATVVAVHPTAWNPRRRDLVRAAARQVAADAFLVPVAVAAGLVAAPDTHDRCVVVEFDESGVTATSLGATGPGRPVVDQVARDPGLDPHHPALAVRLRTLLDAVLRGSEPDVVAVAGEPGEPSGVGLLALFDEPLGPHVRVVPVAAAEMLEALTSAPDEAAQAPPDAGSGAPGSTVLPWLQEVRTRPPESGRSGWMPRAVAVTLVAAATAAVIGGAVYLTTGHGPAPGPTETVAADDPGDEDDTGDEDSSAITGSVRSARFEIGPVHLELPDDWYVRDPGASAPGRVELLPGGGTDRRILVVHSTLAEGVDADRVAEVLTARAAERAEVIRDLDTDTTFGDRRVIAYTELPDGYSVVRWSVLVFPRLQVSVGCQYLEGEWNGIRSECEQAVHTLEAG